MERLTRGHGSPAHRCGQLAAHQSRHTGERWLCSFRVVEFPKALVMYMCLITSPMPCMRPLSWSLPRFQMPPVLCGARKWRAVGSVQMSLAFAGALTSRATLSRLSPQLLPRASPLNIAVPAPRMMVQRTLQRKPIAMATAVGAAYTAGRAPVVRTSPAVCCNLCCQGPYHVLANSSKPMLLHPHALHRKRACVDITLTYSWALRCKKLALAWGMGSAAWP